MIGKIVKLISLCLIVSISLNIGCGKNNKDNNDSSVSNSKAVDNKLYSPGASRDDTRKSNADSNADQNGQKDKISENASNIDGSGSEIDGAGNTGVSGNSGTGGSIGHGAKEEMSRNDIEKTLAQSKAEGIDVDLTLLSSTMIYSEVYNMMFTPEDYVGKTIKMTGAFSYYKDEETGKEYYACIIKDAMACCAQGIEFVLKGKYSYPKDYPEIDDTITVSGVFELYDEGNYKYCRLRDAKMEYN